MSYSCLPVKFDESTKTLICHGQENFSTNRLKSNYTQKRSNKYTSMVNNNLPVRSIHTVGADTGFSVGGGANPPGGRQHTNLSDFPENCMKLRKFWSVGGAPPWIRHCTDNMQLWCISLILAWRQFVQQN